MSEDPSPEVRAERLQSQINNCLSEVFSLPAPLALQVGSEVTGQIAACVADIAVLGQQPAERETARTYLKSVALHAHELLEHISQFETEQAS